MTSAAASADDTGNGVVFLGVHTGCVSHGCVRTDVCPSDPQIIDAGLKHQWNLGESGLIANPMFLQIPHHTVTGCQAVSGAAG